MLHASARNAFHPFVSNVVLAILDVPILLYCLVFPFVREIRSPGRGTRSFWIATGIAIFWTCAYTGWVVWQNLSTVQFFSAVWPWTTWIVGFCEASVILGILMWWEIRFSGELLAAWQLTPRAGRVIGVALILALMVTALWAIVLWTGTRLGHSVHLPARTWVADAGYIPIEVAVVAFPAPWLWYSVVALADLMIGVFSLIGLSDTDGRDELRTVDNWLGRWYRRKKTPGVAAAAEQVLGSFSAIGHLRYARRTGDDRGVDEAMARARSAARAQRRRDDLLYGVLTFCVDYLLASALVARYEQVHARDALAEAISLAERLESRWWLRGAARGPARRLLSEALWYRYERDGDAADLIRAVGIARAAVAAPFTPRRWDCRRLLGELLLDLSQAQGDDSLADAAVSLLRTTGARGGRPGGAALCEALLERVRRDGSGADLAEAAALAQSLEAGAAADGPERAAWLSLLADVASARGELAEASGLSRQAAGLLTAPASDRVEAAIQWARLADRTGDASGALEGYRAAVRLLPRAAWRGMLHQDQRWVLAEWPGLPAEAAAAALQSGDPELAVELLETGRTIMWSQVALLRSAPLHDIALADPDAYRRLNEIREQLDCPAQEGSENSEARTRLAREFEAELDVRGLLRQPSFAELSAAAARGPVVVVNLSRDRSDAIIIPAPGQVTAVRLDPDCHQHLAVWLSRLARAVEGPGVRQIHANRVLAGALEWLWDSVAGPVLDALGAVPSQRIWWCPTGALGLLPLHAAGYHTTEGQRSVLDRYVSSYTPSLSALIAARARAAPASAGPAATRAGRPLVVALLSTPGCAPLPHVQEEVAGLPFEHDTLAGPEATVAAVTAALPGHPLVHFACHGQQRARDPMGSGIVLHDGLLTPWVLAETPLRHGELAYLSACDTAFGDADVADEAVHPAAVLHITGFQHVVAALGPVHDRHSVIAAHEIYAALQDGTEPALAVHRAISTLRQQYPAMPTIWANYVHLGS